MKLPEISIGSEVLRSPKKSGELEWIITNGSGCYASSTVTGMNTRKYHGLLIASENPPLGRKVILSKLEEEAIFEGESFELSTNQYLGAIHPKGYNNQSQFLLDPFPNFLFEVKGVKIKKTAYLVHQKNISIVRYEIINPKKLFFTLKIFPFVNFRSIYSLNKGTKKFDVSVGKKEVKIRFDGKSYLTIKGGDFKVSNLSDEERWYKNFYYQRDAERGEDAVENNYCPGSFEFKVGKSKEVFHVVSGFCSKGSEMSYPEKLVKGEIKRKEKLLRLFYGKNKLPKEDWVKWLVISLDSHIANGDSLIAGYHWFGEWGRDSLISIPGVLRLGREEAAKNIIRRLAKSVRNGLVPNMVSRGEGEETLYNTVDAGLWLVDRVYRIYLKTKDDAFLKEMMPAMEEIIEGYSRGTDYGIRVDCDGLLLHGPGLTWMDARVGDKYITPRVGKAVEIQGLWYNSLMIMHSLLGEGKYLVMAEKAKKSFDEKFWNGEYFDDLSGDKTLRPNQILLLDLPFCIVDDDKREKIISVIEEKLLTEKGLMTLSPDHPDFIGKYEGHVEKRDAAYHQGTIWPWLLGPYVRATGKRELLKPFVEGEIESFGLGTVGEILDAEKPHIPRGCISQAWSLAQLLESL